MSQWTDCRGPQRVPLVRNQRAGTVGPVTFLRLPLVWNQAAGPVTILRLPLVWNQAAGPVTFLRLPLVWNQAVDPV